MFNLPVDIVRHIFKLFLDDNPLEIFHLEKEIFEICEYTIDEISSLIKKSIIKESKVSFLDREIPNNL